MDFLDAMRNEVRRLNDFHASGRVIALHGTTVEIHGLERFLSMGDLCALESPNREQPLSCEVVGQNLDSTLVMPFGELNGIGVGDRVTASFHEAVIYPTEHWLGRVVGARGEVRDRRGALPIGDEAYAIRAQPPAAHLRRALGEKILLGVRALDAFAPCCRGQRMGIFSGSGVGKSLLLSMIARRSQAEVIVVGLIGERSREVKEFLERALGEEGLRRSVIVIATAEEPALARRQAAWTTMAVAEFFRNAGCEVLCLLDSLTRFAMALREIHLAAGEPVTMRGYTPSVFAELPRLLERAGTGIEQSEDAETSQNHSQNHLQNHTQDNVMGNITGVFSVLVEGDDPNEPVSDALRGILDGHVTLSREIAHRNRYPAIDILQTVSRALPNANSDEDNALLADARALIARYQEMEDMIQLGAYRKGSDAQVDRAIAVVPRLEKDFLAQGLDDPPLEFHELSALLSNILQGQESASKTHKPTAKETAKSSEDNRQVDSAGKEDATVEPSLESTQGDTQKTSQEISQETSQESSQETWVG